MSLQIFPTPPQHFWGFRQFKFQAYRRRAKKESEPPGWSAGSHRLCLAICPLCAATEDLRPWWACVLSTSHPESVSPARPTPPSKSPPVPGWCLMSHALHMGRSLLLASFHLVLVGKLTACPAPLLGCEHLDKDSLSSLLFSQLSPHPLPSLRQWVVGAQYMFTKGKKGRTEKGKGSGEAASVRQSFQAPGNISSHWSLNQTWLWQDLPREGDPGICRSSSALWLPWCRQRQPRNGVFFWEATGIYLSTEAHPSDPEFPRGLCNSCSFLPVHLLRCSRLCAGWKQP